MKLRYTKAIIYLAVVLSVFLTIVSVYGGFIPGTYQHEILSLAVQGIGQDIFDLFVIVPLLLISLFFSVRESRTALLIFSGTVFYLVYSFFIYSFGIHFNMLFLFYCFTLGSSLYLFVLLITELINSDVENWFEADVPVKSTAAFFTIIAVIFYFLWFSDIIPAILNNSIPASVSEYNLLVNPVHVLDLSFILPGLIISSVLLVKKQRLSFVLAPILLIFIVLMSLALIAMAVILKIKDVSSDFSLVVIFSVLAIVSIIYLIVFLKRMKVQTA